MDRLDAHHGRSCGELIAFPTVSADSNLDMIAYLAERLETCRRAGGSDRRDPTGTKANLFATLGPERDGGIVLSGHTDVVPVTDQDWSQRPVRDGGARRAALRARRLRHEGVHRRALAMAPRLAEPVSATARCTSPSPMTRKSAASAPGAWPSVLRDAG